MQLKENYPLGILFKLANLVLFTSYSLLLPILGEGKPSSQISFLIMAIASLFLGIAILIKGSRFTLSYKSIKLHFLRATCNGIGMVSWVNALESIGLNEVTAISYSIPIFATILAVIFCNEHARLSSILGIVLGMIGVWIALSPSLEISLLGTCSALLSSFMWASYDIICKKQTAVQHYLNQAFYNFVLTAITLLPFAIYYWEPVSLSYIPKLSMISIIAATNVVVLFLAYSHAPVTVLMPFSYLRLPIMSLATYFVFDIVASDQSLLGAAIITIGSAWTFFQQKTLNKKQRHKLY